MPVASPGPSNVSTSVATPALLVGIPTGGLRAGDLAYTISSDQYFAFLPASTAAVGASVYYADCSLSGTYPGRWVLKISGANVDNKPTQANKNMVAIATAVTTGLQVAPPITYTPAAQGVNPGSGSWVQVLMDGVAYGLGDGVTTDDFYFADPGALGVAKTVRGIVAGDVLVRGSGFLVPTDALDRFSYLYNAVVP